MMKLRLLAPAVVAMTLLSACGSETGPEPQPDGEGQSQPQEGFGELSDLLPEEVRGGEINFAVQQHPPYEFVDGDEYSGPISDLQAEIAHLLGVEFKETLVGGGLDAVLSGLLSGRYDAFAGPSASTNERLEDFDTVSWLHGATTYLVKADDMDDIEGICGGTIAHVTGTKLTEQIDDLGAFCEETHGQGVETLELDNTNSIVLAVESGRATAAVMTSGSAKAVILENDSFTSFTQTEEYSGYEMNLGFILPKDPGIAEAVSAAVQHLIDNGRYAEILEEWGISDEALTQSQVNPPERVQD